MKQNRNSINTEKIDYKAKKQSLKSHFNIWDKKMAKWLGKHDFFSQNEAKS